MLLFIKKHFIFPNLANEYKETPNFGGGGPRNLRGNKWTTKKKGGRLLKILCTPYIWIYLVLPSCARSMFWGLRSLCTIPLLVIAYMAPAKNNSLSDCFLFLSMLIKLKFKWLLIKIEACPIHNGTLWIFIYLSIKKKSSNF